ncbi:MAG: hypothetical protein PVJ39_20855 [Gammaproteobacteria bacterium]
MKAMYVILSAAVWVFSSVSVFAAGERDTFFGMSIERANVDVEGFVDQGMSIKAASGYLFSDFVGFEIQYRNYADLKEVEKLTIPDGNGNNIVVDRERNFSRKELILYLIGNLPLTRTVDLFAKIGRARYDEKVEDEVPGLPSTTVKDQGSETFYGLGTRFDMDEDSAVRFEYETPAQNLDTYIISFGFMHLF